MEEGSSAEILRGILGIVKNCWVHQQSCWVPLTIPKNVKSKAYEAHMQEVGLI